MKGSHPVVVAALALLAACGPARREDKPPVPKPNVDPARTPRPPVRVPPQPPPVLDPPVERVAPAEVAAANGWMPLASTGVDRFRRDHPEADGRGVLIAILDTGVDPSVPGFSVTTTGQPKLVDVRDFSGEGDVPLTRVRVSGDTVEIGGHRLGGLARVRALAGGGPWFGGIVAELPLGVAPAADLNGNGVVRDTLPLLVARATDGWVVFADRDGDGSFSGERPVGDFQRAREWLWWSAPGKAPPAGVAVNLEEIASEPRLTLVYPLDSHGTHVAGIAGGHRIYGAAGLDGAAPGAQLLGLKISNAGQGSVSTTGAIVRALDHAIRFATARRQPLVVNLSFGVGNEIEGSATIDRLVDSVLRRHPQVVLTVSAGNDGPGISTLGFPGSTPRAITVGATIPASFLPPRADGRPAMEPVAFFSGRGGEVAKPDLVAPGVAYSTVPNWDAGDEVKQGTSMAAPQVAGIAALLVSALAERKIVPDRADIRQALMVTATPVGGAGLVESGRGVPNVEAALQWLSRGSRQETVEVDGPNGADGALLVLPANAAPQRSIEFSIHRQTADRGTFRLRSDVPWLRAPARIEMTDVGSVVVSFDATGLGKPGVWSGTVSGFTEDTLAGPAFRLPVTVVRAAPAGTTPQRLVADARVPAGDVVRAPFLADSGRPFEVRITGTATDQWFGFLYEPGGRPFRGGNVLPRPAGVPAVFQVDGSDVVAGAYEAVAGASPASAVTATIEIAHSPAALGLVRRSEREIEARVSNRAGVATELTVQAVLRGAERVDEVVASGGSVRELPVVAPEWARRLVIDVVMDRSQWGRFTDFGVTLFDSAGRRVEAAPLQYAVGRTTVPLGPGGARRLRLDLLPGFADPADREPWRARVILRAYAENEVPLAAAGAASSKVRLAASESTTLTLALPAVPWPMADGYYPLGAVAVTSGDRRWTHEAGLPLLSGNTMP